MPYTPEYHSTNNISIDHDLAFGQFKRINVDVTYVTTRLSVASSIIDVPYHKTMDLAIDTGVFGDDHGAMTSLICYNLPLYWMI